MRRLTVSVACPLEKIPCTRLTSGSFCPGTSGRSAWSYPAAVADHFTNNIKRDALHCQPTAICVTKSMGKQLCACDQHWADSARRPPPPAQSCLSPNEKGAAFPFLLGTETPSLFLPSTTRSRVSCTRSLIGWSACRFYRPGAAHDFFKSTSCGRRPKISRVRIPVFRGNQADVSYQSWLRFLTAARSVWASSAVRKRSRALSTLGSFTLSIGLGPEYKSHSYILL